MVENHAMSAMALLDSYIWTGYPQKARSYESLKALLYEPLKALLYEPLKALLYEPLKALKTEWKTD